MHSSSEAEVCLCHLQVARNTATAVGCKPTHSVTLIRLSLTFTDGIINVVNYVILVT